MRGLFLLFVRLILLIFLPQTQTIMTVSGFVLLVHPKTGRVPLLCLQSSSRIRFGRTYPSSLYLSSSSSSPSSPSSYHEVLLGELNPAQSSAVTQPIESMTRIIAGPGSGKTKVLTSRIAYLLQEDKDPKSNILGVTFTRKAAQEMEQRLEQLLLSMNDDANEKDNNDNNDNDHNGDINNINILGEEEYDASSSTTSIRERRTTDGWLQRRVTLSTFHSVCAKILRYNGDCLASLPSIVNDMLPSENSTNLDSNFNIIDQGDQIRIINECLKQKEIDLKNYPNVRPMNVLDATAKIKSNNYRTFVRNEVIVDEEEELGQQRRKRSSLQQKRKQLSMKMQIAKKIYPQYREQLLAKNCLDFDDLIYLTVECIQQHKDTIVPRLHRRWKHILVDEFQDTSRAQMDLIKLLISNSLFVVGDADQSIYSWRGADPLALIQFAEELQQRQQRQQKLQQYNNHDMIHNSMDANLNVAAATVQTIHLMENYRSTANIVKAAQKVIGGGDDSSRRNGKHSENGEFTNSNSNAQLRKKMKPKRKSGPTPRIVACKDEKAEANFCVQTTLDWISSFEAAEEAATTTTKKPTVAFLYRTNVQSRALEEACVEKGIPYVIVGKATSFYKRKEIKDCLSFLRWLHNGHDRNSMLRIMSIIPGIGAKAIQEFDQYCNLVNNYNDDDDNHNNDDNDISSDLTPLDILISFSENSNDNNNTNTNDNDINNDIPLPSNIISKRAMKSLHRFSEQMQSIRTMAYEQTVEELISTVIDEFELMSYFDTHSKSKAEFQERQSNVQELQKAARKYKKDGPCLVHDDEEGIVQDTTTTNNQDKKNNEEDDLFMVSSSLSPLATFVDDIALVTDIYDSNNNDDDEEGKENPNNNGRFVVNLMTIHASKGMEFDSVFVVGNEDQTFPTSQAISKGPGSVELEEERRICYVAMTRAKTNLYLTWRKKVTIFSVTTSNKYDRKMRTVDRERSRFLDVLVSDKKKKSGTKEKDNYNDDDNNYNDYNNVKKKLSLSPSSSWAARSDKRQRQQPRRQLNSDFRRPDHTSYSSRNDYSQQPSKTTTLKKTFTTTATTTATNGGDTYSGVTGKNNGIAQNVYSKAKTLLSSPSLQHETARRTPTNNNKTRQNNKTSTTRSGPKKKRDGMDSTWFYPVGSSVVHSVHGQGIVLNPFDHSEVRVQFQNGKLLDLPVSGTDLRLEL